MKYFIFPNDQTGFNPKDVDLLNFENYHLISPNLYRVQKFGSLLSGFWFRHHLETKIDTEKELKGTTYRVIQSAKNLEKIIKFELIMLEKIISLGEY